MWTGKENIGMRYECILDKFNKKRRSIYPFKRINSFFPSQGSIESYADTVITGAVGTAWKYFAKRLGESIVIANSSNNSLAIRCFPWRPEKEDGGLSFTKDFKERKRDSFSH